MDISLSTDNATPALKDASFATMPPLAKNVLLLFTLPMIKKPVLLPALMDLPPDKGDALLAMSNNVNHAIPTKIPAKNASSPEPCWTKIVFLLAHQSCSTELRMD
jgi:hypothetical protein